MSVYAELIKVGINEEAASKITEATDIHYRLITSEQFDSRINDIESKLVGLELKIQTEISKMEIRLHNKLWVIFGTMTGIFGVFIGLMTWALK